MMGMGKARQKFGVSNLNPGGQWKKWKPIDERQAKNSLETYNCVYYATAKAYIALSNFLKFDDFPKEISERYGGVVTGTTREQGNSPHQSIEKTRTMFGFVLDSLLPWTNQSTWEGYYSPNPMDESLVKEGQNLLRKFELGHEWVLNFASGDVTQRLMTALERGPVCAAVYAWKKNGKYYTKTQQENANHWIWIMGYKKGEYWIVSDQYSPFEKRLAWDYAFEDAKVYFLKRNESGIAPFEADYFSSVLKRLAEMIRKLLS